MPKQTGSIDLKAIKKAGDIASNTNQYFWFKDSGTDTGAHITEIPQDTFESNPSGGNLLANTNGVAIRKGTDELATFSYDVVRGNNEQGTKVSSASGRLALVPNATSGIPSILAYDVNGRPITMFGYERCFSPEPRAVFTSTNTNISLSSSTVVKVPLTTVSIGRNNTYGSTGSSQFMSVSSGSAKVAYFDGFGVEITASVYVIPSANALVNIFLYHGTTEVAAGAAWLPATYGGAVQLTPRIIAPVYANDTFYIAVRTVGTTGTVYCSNKDTQLQIKYI